ncbi:MAG: nicotinate (nicotinamide) nucleotide adenylyltransferase [Flavobacteriaceae bacterium]|jgi:nicotinate-nucleotide adenylyltransferase|nr:nicotinate (nicotinamide) nucleotide adenylyltransferase [Flavobacteriaceae bacterium]MDO7581944.1 nicotinate (nicotinamide) nucleotide adenylyltransferase [Flavobacteriaceae bacterium]MDO7591230.1 nicotinate (nicotinamide) nucleotide adenylyltransferase [Flavobacteriaceae bacterium]MDO7598350.1 nicotinate (nicotinamide) nucleotide adenylyltransferase [Flavobacteriaceae bacterium]MDO7604015.1 nicotinate (nicotinamide) nucleotide adenylyltransferase [Flavobacteriaceae bacterium]|tara:strand:- start:350 stop:931 length:582 start_codon:yes stop_codon:yes gene_type:complete
MKKIGLYFGTFNPIHIGHLILANHFAETTDLDEVWLVVTPQNPMKRKDSILDNHHRLELVYKATYDYPKLRPSDIEFGLPMPNYTINSLTHIEEKHPDKQFVLLMGEDNLVSFPKWKNYELILERYELYVYPRKTDRTIPKQFQNNPKINLIDAPQIELSSSAIRKSIKANQNIRPLLPPESWLYLDEMNFYK